jgi:hypothetical protein
MQEKIQFFFKYAGKPAELLVNHFLIIAVACVDAACGDWGF